MKIHVRKQKDATACGPTCIKMTTDFFKLKHSLRQIEIVSQYKKKDGLTNEDLIETIRKLDLYVRVKTQARWSDLQKANKPDTVVIVSWMMDGYIGHFSVVERVSDHSVYLADPAKGKIIRLDKIMFMRLWMDYDDLWFPKKNTDIQLRWMAIVSL